MCDITAELTAIKNEFENIKWQAGLCQEAIAIKNELENIKWHHDLCKEALDIKKELDRIKQEYDRLASQKPTEVKKEEPKKEEPKKEEPKKVEPKKEEPKKVEVKKEEPKKEEPKKVEPKKEEPKKEEPKKEEPKKNMSPESAAIEAKLIAFKEGKLGSKDLNLNNSRAHFILPDFADLLCEGLRADTKEVETLQLSNCCLSTEAAKKIVEAVCANTTIHVLALETNKIGADGITFIGEALKTNTTIRELKLANQLQKAGTIAERAFVEALKSNTTLVKCSFPIFDSSARNSLERILMHNANLARRAKTTAAAPAKPATTSAAPKPAAAPAAKPTTTAAAPKPAATTSAAPAAKPTTPAAPAGGDGKVYTYEELLKKPAGLDRTKLESYLSDEEFAKVFGMDKEAFYKLAKWKQGDKKKAAKLY